MTLTWVALEVHELPLEAIDCARIDKATTDTWED